MSTAFETQVTEAWPAFVELDGQTVSYTPKGGAAVELTAIVGPVRSEPEASGEFGRQQIERRDVTITTDPASPYGGVTAPAENATVTIGGTVWPIDGIDVHGTLAMLHCRRELVVERSRPGYRGR